MRRKAWIKRRRNSVKLDRRKTMRMWTIIVVVCVVVAFMLSGLVHAQPELKVGQEVKVWQRFDDGRTHTCAGQIVRLGGGGLETFPSKANPGGCVIFMDDMVGYRILKPAPRPEFELVSCGSNQACIEANLVKMVGELRSLRKEIEALKK